MKRTFAVLSLAALLLALCGCQATPPVMSDSQAQQMLDQLTVMQQEMADMKQEMESLHGGSVTQTGQTLSSELAALQEQIAAMQQQVQTLQGTGGQAPTTAVPASTGYDALPSQSPAQAPQVSSVPASDSQDEETLADFETQIAAHEQRVEAASGNTNDMNLYRELRKENNQLEQSMDRYEDELKQRRRQGELTQTDYRRLDDAVEGLEDRLDNAQDRLERMFGVDD